MATSVERFRRVISVAYAHLEARREEVNDLNVFPVPDGDTGDNMVLTMRHVLEELDRLENDGAGEIERAEVVEHVARAALMGARGNSGVILSQIVRGAAEELATPPGRLIDPILISAALSNATRAAYASVREPAEGTMLTVIREMSDAVSRRLAHWEQHKLSPDATDAEQNALLGEMLAIALSAAEEAVAHTPEQLDILAEAGVVDAGALGLAVIVRGAIAGLAGEQVVLPEIPHYEPPLTVDVHHIESRFQWCTNFVVIGDALDRRLYERRLEELGDSVLVVGDPSTLKVHVHTDDPDAAKALFDDVGTIEREDIADMREQIAARDARLAEARTGVLAIASGEGLSRLFGELGAIVIDGGPTFNPSTSDILDGIGRVPAREVVILPNSSDAILASEEAAKMTDRAAVVVPSRSQQGALAALVELNAGGSATENATRLSHALDEIRVGSVARAAKDDPDGRFARDDCVGIVNGEVAVWGDDAGTTLSRTVGLLAEEAELVTVIEGADPPISVDDLGPLLPNGVEVETHYGGQRLYWWLIAAQ
jgi:fatty acid kinase